MNNQTQIRKPGWQSRTHQNQDWKPGRFEWLRSRAPSAPNIGELFREVTSWHWTKPLMIGLLVVGVFTIKSWVEGL